MRLRANHTLFFFSVILTACACLSCEHLDSDIHTSTGPAAKITLCKALLTGSLVLSQEMPNDLICGFLYSTSSDVTLDTATRLDAQEVDEHKDYYGFTVVADLLVPETHYYYRSFTLWKDKVVYGAVNQFTTLPVSSVIRTNAATDIGVGAATLNASLDLSGCEYETMDYGFRLLPQISAEVLYPADNLSDGKFSLKVESLNSGQMYYVSAWVSMDGRKYTAERKSFVTQLEHKPEAVDMGLSVKWASFNVGAEKPEDYGDRYAWGELSEKPKYEWENYIFYQEDPSGNFSVNKYSRADNLSVLETKDDVAAQKYGENWRMPTDEEWMELLNKDKCSWTLTTENEIEGYRVTSSKTGNSLFLPRRHYWSSVVDRGVYYSDARSVEMLRGLFLRSRERYYGDAVRPVCD